jgi:hypothetical protein
MQIQINKIPVIFEPIFVFVNLLKIILMTLGTDPCLLTIRKDENTMDINVDEERYRNGGLYDPNRRGPVSTG